MNKYTLRRAAVIAFIIAAEALITSFISYPKAVVQWQEYMVMPGDTIWDIACGEYGDDVDIRWYTDMIIKENGIDAGRLHPGDVILIPMEAE